MDYLVNIVVLFVIGVPSVLFVWHYIFHMSTWGERPVTPDDPIYHEHEGNVSGFYYKFGQLRYNRDRDCR